MRVRMPAGGRSQNQGRDSATGGALSLCRAAMSVDGGRAGTVEWCSLWGSQQAGQIDVLVWHLLCRPLPTECAL